MFIKLFKEINIYSNLFEKNENDREINIYKLKDCIATGYNLYYPNILFKTDDSDLILPLLERTMSLNSGTIYEKSDMSYNYQEKSMTEECNEPLFFFVYNTDNYYHFIYDSLPYLITYCELKKSIPNIKLLMQYPNPQKSEFYRFVIEFLNILAIYNEDIILINDYTQYKEIYISTSYTHDKNSNSPPRKEIFDFYHKIVKIVREKHLIETPKKIYISRRTWLHNDFSNIGTNYTTRRKLVNEDELVEYLISNGYKEVFTENLTTIEKILYFANATDVVGAIGGGISNVVFSPKATKLVAIISPTFLDVNARFQFCLENVEVQYYTNTQHTENSEFKTYMRIRSNDGKILGEIEKIYDNKLLVSYSDSLNTGWNAQSIYKQIELDCNDVKKIDDGLNSPWKISNIFDII